MCLCDLFMCVDVHAYTALHTHTQVHAATPSTLVHIAANKCLCRVFVVYSDLLVSYSPPVDDDFVFFYCDRR